MSETLKSIAIPVKPKARRSRAPAPSSPSLPPQKAFDPLAGRPRAAGAAPAPAHAYGIGQRLVYRTLMGNSTCTVLRLLPVEKGVLSYRVRSDIESYERNVEESALSLPR
ncbi:hypothetical protein SAMN02983003_2825 [Devosia enhydra]|uniref:Uncharacterized protein n=1 Tax=Devosia enhydra TaxID=665118 RepID=A0A1K2I005_9HYPH|nr:hypothetical protein [Devosia enhydra]SFZ85657.1 hypothetical protein SAMN02983003_2825 [Devosia enhydra]